MLLFASFGRTEKSLMDAYSLKSRGRSMDFTAMSNTYIQRVMESVNQKFSYKRYGQNTELHTVDAI